MGIRLDTRLTWRPHIEELLPKLASAVYAIKRIRTTINTSAARSTYFALFHSRMSYGLKVWGASSHSTRVLIAQKMAVRALEDAVSTEPCRPLFIRHGIMTLYATYAIQQLTHARKHLNEYQRRCSIHDYGTRQHQQIQVPFRRLATTSFTTSAVQLYNALPDRWKEMSSKALKRRITGELMALAPYSFNEIIIHLASQKRTGETLREQ